MGVLYTNNAKTTLSSGINNSVTSISVASSSTFPSITGSNYFYATFDDLTNVEVVKVTAISGTTWTVVRAQDDTSARAWDSGDAVELRLNVALLEDALGDAASFSTDTFTGDGSTTAFTLGRAPASETELIVFIGVVFQAQDAYSISSTTLTFSAAPANTRPIVVYSTEALAAGSVGTASIIDDAITQAKIADDAVGADQLAASAVVTASIVNDNVTQAKIADDAVGADQLASNAVVTASIVDDAVTTAKILNSNVTQAKIADNAISLAKMAGITRGSIIIGDSSGDPAALAVGSNGQILTSDGTDISWGSDTVLTTEQVQDITGAQLVTNGSHTGITASYDDAGDGAIDLAVGTLNQNTTGTAAIATTVTITDNENTNETNAIIFTAGGDVDGGNLGLESDGDLTYNPSSGTLTATTFVGNITGTVTGTATGLAGTPNVTVGTVTSGVITSTGSSSFSTSVKTPLIEYTDGDDAITIADGGGITAAAGITSTAASNTLGATSFNDANITNVGSIALDSITSDAGTGTAITFSVGAAGSTETANKTGSVGPDMSQYTNFVWTLTGNLTLTDPGDEAVGQSGIFVFIQDGTGSRTLTHSANQFFTAGAAAITLSTAANSIDVVPYFVQADGKIHLGKVQAAFADA